MSEPVDKVVIGHITIDINSMPEGNVGNVLGGTPTYSGLTLEEFGERVGMVSKIGEEAPRRFFSDYNGGSLDTGGILVKSRETTRFENNYSVNGEREQICTGFSGTINPEDIPQGYLNASGFYISPVLNEVPPETIKKVSNKSEGTLMFDPQGTFRNVREDGRISLEKPDNIEKYLRYVDILKIGLDELTVFDESYEKVLKDLLRPGPKVAIVTLGGRGAKVMDEDGEFIDVEALNVNPKDITGAGDVFGAAFLHDYLKNEDLEKATSFANAAAGLKIRHEGPTGFPEEREIRQALEN